MDNVKSVSAGEYSTFAITMDNTLWGWGLDWFTDEAIEYIPSTQRRIIDINVRANPVKVMDDVVAVSVGSMHVLVIRTDGSLWSWGNNLHGAVGVGKASGEYHSPKKIMDDVVAISAGPLNSMAVKSDGSLWVWGSNYYNGKYGVLGVNSTAVEYIEKPVKIMEKMKSVSTSLRVSLAIKEDGSLYAWGENPFGSVGNGTESVCISPVKIMDGVVYASAGDCHTVAVKSDASLWAWGFGMSGQLGDGISGNTHALGGHRVYNPKKIIGGIKLPTTT